MDLKDRGNLIAYTKAMEIVIATNPRLARKIVEHLETGEFEVGFTGKEQSLLSKLNMLSSPGAEPGFFWLNRGLSCLIEHKIFRVVGGNIVIHNPFPLYSKIWQEVDRARKLAAKAVREGIAA